jgi:hypothetical protein
VNGPIRTGCIRALTDIRARTRASAGQEPARSGHAGRSAAEESPYTPPVPDSDRPTHQSWLTTLGWAAYLACSWTWCIGMFLPVLLVRDFGLWGFVVFAVPNVIGAAGMAWVLRSAGSAARIGTTHSQAVRLFSEITWLFHVFFLVWLLESNAGLLWAPIAIICVFVIASYVFVREKAKESSERWWSTVAWCMSAGIAVFVLLQPDSEVQRESPPLLDAGHLCFLAPVCAFGFMLCPYLDATFLKARRLQSLGAARASFGIGFGVLFAAMIVFTLLYAGQFGEARGPASFRSPTGIVAALVFIHMGIQLAFTIGVHGTACRQLPGKEMKAEVRGSLSALLMFAFLLLLRVSKGDVHAGLTIGEITYRTFMACYGLIFPAYVWLCMVPAHGEFGTQKPSREKLRVLIIAVTLAAPCYWMGFIERQTWWLGPGLFIVLAARVFVQGGRGPAPNSA